MDTPKLNVGDKVRFKNYDDPNGTSMQYLIDHKWRLYRRFSGDLWLTHIEDDRGTIYEMHLTALVSGIPLHELELVEACELPLKTIYQFGRFSIRCAKSPFSSNMLLYMDDTCILDDSKPSLEKICQLLDSLIK